MITTKSLRKSLSMKFEVVNAIIIEIEKGKNALNIVWLKKSEIGKLKFLFEKYMTITKWAKENIKNEKYK